MVIPPERVALALKIARGFARRLPRSVQLEDVEAAAMMGLFKALLKQPTGEGDGFEGFIRMRIRGAIIDELRHQDWLPRRARASSNPARIIHLEDIRTSNGAAVELPSPHAWEPEEDIDRQRTIEQMWQTPMPERDRRVMRACYGGKMPRKHESVADDEHVSPARISQIAGRSIVRMRAHLAAAQEKPER